MLQNLHVKNLALIDEIEIDFQRGLNILTGETGAGKSIVLGSVSLALGGRYSRDILRQGAKYGLVELTFAELTPAEVEKLEALEIYPEEGAVVLSRRLMEGRSISRINGETVNMSALKSAAEILIDIHGQHEHQTLFYKKNQLDILDSYAGKELKKVSEGVRNCYREYKKCLEEYQQAIQDEAGRAKELSFLEFEIQEIEEAELIPGEDEHLEKEYRRMNHAKNTLEDAAEAYRYTGGEDGASELLSRAIRCVSDASRFDERAEELCHQLTELDGLLNDFNRELSEYQSSLEFSDEDYRMAEERLNQINHMKTKYGSTIGEILEYCEKKRKRLEILNDYDVYLVSLKKKLTEKEDVLKELTDQLSKLREDSGKILEDAIGKELQDLNSSKVKFEIRLKKLSDYSAIGRDEVEFFISMNQGEPVRPLSEVASGGELSRTMLAIKTVMADRDEIATLIFDEIDSGISGRTAQKVSEKMKVIGSEHQVICITHLAQIAAMADAHYVIEKSFEDGKTRTGIRLLNEEQSVGEIARILGGAEITDTVIRSAEEMKELARREKYRT